MNGEVNETMEEVTSKFVPETELGLKKCITEENETSVDSESRNHIDSESNGDHKNNDDLNNGSNKNGEGYQSDKRETYISKVPVDENSINDTISNDCSNSNESYPESATSSQGNSKTSEEHLMHNEDEKSKDGQSEIKRGHSDSIQDEECHEVSDGDSEEEGSILSGDVKAEDTVSINSVSDVEDGDDSSNGSETKDKDNDIIILENDRSESQNGKSQGSVSASPEVHEITSDNDDDCLLTNDNDEKSNSSVSEKTKLRRSSRAIKRKKYDLDDIENGIESDVEEIEMDDPLGNNTKPIVINDTRSLVEMASKKMKLNQNNKKKEPTVVIIDTHTGKGSSQPQLKTAATNSNAQNIYQSIVARGTTVTPVSVKNKVSQNSPQNSQTSILPSLTDDMFVVEAPSFIVPYVYEKPSVKPFREFVDKLGKELEEQAAKEAKERLEKEKQEKEKRAKERQERKDRGEDVSASEDENAKIEAEEKKKRRAEKREKHRLQNEDDVSWDGESTSDSDEESDDDSITKNKDKDDSIEEIKDVTDLSAAKVCNKSDNYFDCSLGKFFVDIGVSLVQEYVQTDLLKQQNRKLTREKKSGQNTRQTQTAIASLMKNLEFSKENNAPYTFPQKKCEFCSFKTDSELVLHNHLETPHMKNNVYKCNFCEFEIRSPHDILSHMELAHQVRGKLERAPAYHQCYNCQFEDNGKGKLARHQLACAKKFKPDLNLAPPIEWEPPAKIPKVARARNNMMGAYQGGLNRQVGSSLVRTPVNFANMMASGGAYRPRGRSPLAAPPRASVLGLPIMRGALPRHTPVGLPNFPNNIKSKSMHQPSISITPLPRQPAPSPAPAPVVPPPSQSNKNTFVICEICDGYIKDLEQLRNHMQWIHKVKIHPKMIYNRPPLNCQKCQFRFFTDQGLERHLLGSHGLVTSSMQEAANKGKDAGRCPVCGRVYQWKLLNHVSKDHNLTLKPAHLSYKCTVCTATFGMYKLFENHVYSAHSVVAKRVMDKSKTSTPVAKPNDTLLKPLKINDEITIIPQPVKATSTRTK